MLTIYQSEAEQEILETMEEAQRAMTRDDGMTDSDLQGRVMAIVMKYVPEVRPV